METSSRFFGKLRSLAVLLDTERDNLEHGASQNLDQDDDETGSGAAQALHELHSEVRALKKRVQSQVASQESVNSELRNFIKACMVLKQRTTEDIEKIQRHFERYGYKPQKGFLRPDVNCKDEINSKLDADDKPEEQASEEASDEELVEAPECETPEKMPPPVSNPMRTPQLSDFGLSALHLQIGLGNSDTFQDLAPVPAIDFTPPSLPVTMCEPQPKTPKCSLSMDEEALTPRLEDFGITESTMCFNNDFTMDLFRKKPPKDRQTTSARQQVASDSLPAAPTCISLGRLSADSMDSPEVPVFSTLEIKTNKQLGKSSGFLPSGEYDPESPTRPNATTPELPAFETPYIRKLISAKKVTKQNEGEHLNGLLKNTSYPVEDPSVSLPSSETLQMPVSLVEERTPEMPKLQSFFSRTLPCTETGHWTAVTEPPGPALQNDEHTQDWCLATPRIRMQFDVEPRTPEMPDMSFVTQDIIKLVAQANNKQAATPSLHANSKANLNTVASGKENRAQIVAQVSEKEFYGLASYMKQIPLISLNLALNKINQVLEERRTGGGTKFEEFHMEDLRKILDVGPQTPIYILCLVELKRLENVQGFGRNASFKVLTQKA